MASSGDGDSGPNNLQNFPVLTSAVTDGVNQVTLTGSLNSTAGTTFRIEFFANSAADASGYGEGQRYLGFANVTTDGSGNATINVTLSSHVVPGEFIAATATDPGGPTSEFGQVVAATIGSPIVGDSFLQGSYLELGFGTDGVLGSDLGAPGGFLMAGSQLAVVANRNLDGWATHDGDFLLPGSPEEAWGVQVGGTTYTNSKIAAAEIAGNLSKFQSSGSGQSVDWIGSVAGLAIGTRYTINQTGMDLDAAVTLTNTTGATLNNVYYYRNTDPDNNALQTGDYATTNTIVAQGNDGGEVAYVTATQADGSAMALLGFGANARVTHGGFINRDPVAIYNGTGGLSASGTLTADEGISLAFLVTALSPGASTTLHYRYEFAPGSAPVLDLDADNSSASGADFAATFTEGGPPVSISDTDATVFDPDSAMLTGLTATITTLADGAAEQLAADTSGTAITASYNPGLGQLSLTGADTVAHYRQVLRTLTYTNSSQNPNTTPAWRSSSDCANGSARSR